MASSSRLPSLPPLDTDHRKLLNPHQLNDSPVTDQGNSSDEALPDLIPEDVVGVSISRVQTYLKSPKTPSLEKQRILEQSPDYFNLQTKPADISEIVTEDGESSPGLPPVSPWQSHPPLERKSSFATTINDVRNAARRRSRSSSNMFDNLMKMLPDLPSMPSVRSPLFFSSISGEDGASKKFSNEEEPMTAGKSSQAGDGKLPIRSKPFYSYIGDRKESTGQEASAKEPTVEGAQLDGCREVMGSVLTQIDTSRSSQSKRHSDSAVTPSATRENGSHTGLDGNVESLLGPYSPSSNKLRRNSESSLYLSRRVSGASAFDDTSVYAHVTDMANSRFKAIADSFQSSTIRFPRLQKGSKPTVRNPDMTDETNRNTAMNSGHPNHEHVKQYTNMHDIRKSKKLIDIETSLNRAHPVFFDALEQLEGDLVVMGGYRGSILRDAKPPHRQLWAPVKVGLNLRKADLEVGLSREDEENATDKIIPSGILSHIGPIDICRRLLKHSRKCANAKCGKLRTHDWGYDWRLSPDLLAGRLIRYLEGLECNQPGVSPEKRGVWMIAHSLGGLITRYVVNQRPELFAGVLYAGTPTNCVNILGPLRNGDNVLLSQKVLTAQVNFTIRTSFALLPEDGRCFIQKDTNERYDLDFFDPQTWEDHHLSPCIRQAVEPPTSKQRERGKSIVEMMTQSVTSLPRPSIFGGSSEGSRDSTRTGQTVGSNSSSKQDSTSSQAGHTARATAQYAENLVTDPVGEATVEPGMGPSKHKSSVATTSTLDPAAARKYLARTLGEVLAFKQALVHNPDLQSSNRYPPHALIFGKTVPTVYGARVASKEAIKYTTCYDDLAFAAGDGVVLASAAQMPEGYRVVRGGRIESDRGHVGLMGDLEGVGRALRALLEGRKKGIGMGNYEKGA